jgi:hypothetical protein
MENLLNCKRDPAFKDKLKKALVQNLADYRCASSFALAARSARRGHGQGLSLVASSVAQSGCGRQNQRRPGLD